MHFICRTTAEFPLCIHMYCMKWLQFYSYLSDKLLVSKLICVMGLLLHAALQYTTTRSGRNKQQPGRFGRNIQQHGRSGRNKQPGRSGHNLQQPGRSGRNKQQPGRSGRSIQ